MRQPFMRLTAVMVFSGALVSVNFCVGLGSGNLCFAQVPRTPPSRPTRPKPEPPTLESSSNHASVRALESVYVLNVTDAEVEISNVGTSPIRIKVGTTNDDVCNGFAPTYGTAKEVTPINGHVKARWKIYFSRPAAAGKTCPMYVYWYRNQNQQPLKLTAGTVKIEPAQTYKIEQTWAIVPLVSRVKSQVVGSGMLGSCEGSSVGLSGVIPIGLAENNDVDRDLSFHLRSGAWISECVYDSVKPYRDFKKGWVITDSKWKVERVRGENDTCSVSNFSGAGVLSRYFYIHAQLRCEGGPDNNNGVRVTLQSITLMGPQGKTYLDAFR